MPLDPNDDNPSIFTAAFITAVFIWAFILCMARVDAAAAKTTAQLKVGIVIAAPAGDTSAAKVAGSSGTTSVSKPSCPKQDSAGTINLVGKTWAC